MWCVGVSNVLCGSYLMWCVGVVLGFGGGV